MAREPEYVERMFPEPVDLGIAEPDRAVSSVTHGTRAFLEEDHQDECPASRARTHPCLHPESAKRKSLRQNIASLSLHRFAAIDSPKWNMFRAESGRFVCENHLRSLPYSPL